MRWLTARAQVSARLAKDKAIERGVASATKRDERYSKLEKGINANSFNLLSTGLSVIFGILWPVFSLL